MSDETAPDPFAPVPNCSPCAQWEADPKSGAYESDCANCKARAIARSPGMWRALRGESNVEVREAIARCFGAHNLKRGRELVHAWSQKLTGATQK